MDTEGMLGAAGGELAEENNLIVNLLHRHVVVLDTGSASPSR